MNLDILPGLQFIIEYNFGDKLACSQAYITVLHDLNSNYVRINIYYFDR
jgi:hypothetical protein